MKRSSVFQLLFRCARRLNEEALARASRMYGAEIRPVHAQLFPHVDLEGTRQTVLAERLGVTKQAVGQLVDDLERMGVLERVPDPSDGRAKLVRFTHKEGSSLMDGMRFLKGFEEEMAELVGHEVMEALGRGLLALLEEVDRPTPESDRLPEVGEHTSGRTQ
ncbi:MAG: helix-turn-helix domain-containing protein [Myxococcota bacterium]